MSTCMLLQPPREMATRIRLKIKCALSLTGQTQRRCDGRFSPFDSRFKHSPKSEPSCRCCGTGCACLWKWQLTTALGSVLSVKFHLVWIFFQNWQSPHPFSGCVHGWLFLGCAKLHSKPKSAFEFSWLGIESVFADFDKNWAGEAFGSYFGPKQQRKSAHSYP